MPTPVDNLTKTSSPKAIKDAIGQCIQMEMQAGKDQKQAAGMCYAMASEKTGQEIA